MVTMSNEQVHKEWLALSIERLLEIKANARRKGDWLMENKADHYLALKPQGFAKAIRT